MHEGINSNDPLANGPSASQARVARLKELFKDVDPIEVTETVDLAGKNAREIAALLPRFTTIQQQGSNPAFGLLVDPKSGRVWALRSGFSPGVLETFEGITFRAGTITREIAKAAGDLWSQELAPLGAHLEGQAAAFMRHNEIAEAELYINGIAPCKYAGIGCMYRLQDLLAEGSQLTVYNKNGRRIGPFLGIPD